MDNKDLKIKSLKTIFRDSSELATPVIKAFTKSLNHQESYSPLLVETFNTNGFEVISPSKQGRFWYEISAKSPLTTSLLSAGIIGSIVFAPVYSIPLVGLGLASAAYTHYYLTYFNSKIDKGYRDLQSGKEDIGVYLKSLIALKKQLSDFPDDFMPVDLKAKNIRKMVGDIISLIGHSIYINIEKSDSVNVKDIVNALIKLKELYSSGSHPEMYFYDVLAKSSTMQKKEPELKDPETIIDLGSKPEFSVKDDAISEGIKMAKQLAEQKPPHTRKKRKSKKPSRPEQKPEPESAKQKDEIEKYPGLETKNEQKENSEAQTASTGKENRSEKEKTEGGLVSPGGSMRTNAPIVEVHDEEDREFLEALNERDDANLLDQMEDDDDELPEAQFDDPADFEEGLDKLMSEFEVDDEDR